MNAGNYNMKAVFFLMQNIKEKPQKDFWALIGFIVWHEKKKFVVFKWSRMPILKFQKSS